MHVTASEKVVTLTEKVHRLCSLAPFYNYYVIVVLLYHQLHWAMVGAVNFVVDACRLYFVCQTVRDDEVVDAPAGVLFAGVKAV